MSALDREMGLILTQLLVVANAPAAGFQPRSSSGKAGSRDLTGGDHGEAEQFKRRYGPPFHPATHRYPGARTDRQRQAVIEEARAHLEHLRGTGRSERPVGESDDETVERMLRDGRGEPPERIAASSFRMSASTVRKHRRRAGLDPETGRAVAGRGRDEAEARRLLGENMSVRYVAMRTCVPKSTLQDWKREQAA